MMMLNLDRKPSPVGEILLVTDGAGILRALDFFDYEPRMMRLLGLHYGEVELAGGRAPALVHQALEAYFDGQIAAIDGVPATTGGTDFQREVWAALRTIGAGQTLSYGELAARIGRPAASRAVGAANGANPVGLIVPCHRVIGKSGSLTGYGGGLDRKLWLLEHEQRHAPAKSIQGRLI